MTTPIPVETIEAVKYVRKTVGDAYIGVDAEAKQSALRQAMTVGFEAIAAFEEASGSTIQRSHNIRQLADRGTPYPAALAQPSLVEAAERDEWSGAIIVPPDEWKLPVGAGGENAGPS